MLKSNLIIFTCFAFCFEAQLFSQVSFSKYEFTWALIHPFSSIKIKNKLKEAMEIHHIVKLSGQLDTFESGGKLDAFKHTFTMAYLSRYVKVDKLRKLGRLHEKGNKDQFFNNKEEDGERADSLACEMDLRNNELGFLIGTSQKNIQIEALKNLVLLQIIQGNAWYLKKSDQNEYISCNNEPICLKNYKDKWYVPKCLIKTNE